jgi:8-oxo-dGTP pyrophosphatase MutT (NUDIX family)
MDKNQEATTPVIERVAARVLLVDPDGRTLLFRGVDPSRRDLGTWWFTPGGGVDPGETLDETAHREVYEETGISIPQLGRPVSVQHAVFTFEGITYDQEEYFFIANVGRVTLDDSGWTEIERRSVLEHRWWSVKALRETAATVFPENLPDLLTAVQTPGEPSSLHADEREDQGGRPG